MNVNGSLVDDAGFRAIGENCDKLIELDAGDTYISNVGLTYLSFDELMPVMQCLPGLQIYRYYFKLVQATHKTIVRDVGSGDDGGARGSTGTSNFWLSVILFTHGEGRLCPPITTGSWHPEILSPSGIPERVLSYSTRFI